MVILINHGWFLKDKQIRKNYEKYEIKKLILKSLMSSKIYNINLKLYFCSLFLYFNEISSISRYRNSCLFSHYGRSIFRQFKLSRHFAKHFASNGFLLGLRKSSF